jgi:hypothetical protein
MQPFRRVEDRKAGPTAVGILVPPGQRTVVIVRPRALPWDLLPATLDAESLRFRDFGRDEAAGVARQLHQHMERHALEKTPLLEVQGDVAGLGFLVWARQMELVWIVCLRRPGQPYEALQFASLEEAQEAAHKIAVFLCPSPEAGQEVYFNTQHFSR